MRATKGALDFAAARHIERASKPARVCNAVVDHTDNVRVFVLGGLHLTELANARFGSDSEEILVSRARRIDPSKQTSGEHLVRS